MNKESIDVIIVAGGKGMRMGDIISKYGCKSLILLEGIPCIDFVIYSIREVLPKSKIILCVDNKELIKKFHLIIKSRKLKNIEIYNDQHRGPVQAIYEASGKCTSKKVLVFFGNQIITPEDITRLLSHDDDSVVFSTFNNTTENHCKIANVKDSRITSVSRHSEVKKLLKNQKYIDVPYCLPLNFFSMETFPVLKKLFIKAPMVETSIDEGDKVFSVNMKSPGEFHFVEEIKDIENFIKKHLSGAIKSLGGQNFK